MGILIVILSAVGTIIAAKLAVAGLVQGSISFSSTTEITGLFARILGIVSLAIGLALGGIVVFAAYAVIKSLP